jgi:hypothetical protein
MLRGKNAMETTRISFFIPEGLQQDLKERMVKEGYSLKAKSKWISEAIESLLSLKSYPELVKMNDEMHGFEKPEYVSMPRSLKSRLDAIIVDFKQTYPLIDGVQSRILRTAIIQRLLQGKS